MGDNLGIGGEDLLPFKGMRVGAEESSVGVHRAERRQLVLLPSSEVLGAVAGRGVDDAGALVRGDVAGHYGRDFAVEPGVTENDALERAPRESRHYLGLTPARADCVGGSSQPRLGYDKHFAGAATHGDIVKIGMEGKRHTR